MIEPYREPDGVGRKQVNGHDEHGTSFTDCKTGDPPHGVSRDRDVKGGKGRKDEEVDWNELVYGSDNPRQQWSMLGVDELKAECAPHEDLGRVLVHVAGIHVAQRKANGSQEKQEKEGTSDESVPALSDD